MIDDSDSHADRCTFCAVLQDAPRHPLQALLGDEAGSRCLLRETSRFAVIPALGSLVPGYLLIVPKAHVPSMGHLPPAALQEFAVLLAEVAGVLFRAFAPPIFFEHGSAGFRLRDGVTTDHAHTHCVPLPAELDFSDALTDAAGSAVREICGFGELREPAARGSPYLFWRSRDGSMWLCDARRGVSQPFRRPLARFLGVEDRWDWRQYPGKAQIRHTLAHFSAVPWSQTGLQVPSPLQFGELQ